MAVIFPIQEHIAKNVHVLRKQAGLTLVALAELAGVGKTAVFDIEHKKATVQLDTLLKVLTALNIGLTLQVPEIDVEVKDAQR
jgi:transcriptional regulator with XRE-family HTH domain